MPYYSLTPYASSDVDIAVGFQGSFGYLYLANSPAYPTTTGKYVSANPSDLGLDISLGMSIILVTSNYSCTYDRFVSTICSCCC